MLLFKQTPKGSQPNFIKWYLLLNFHVCIFSINVCCLCKFCVVVCAIRAGTAFIQILFNVFLYFSVIAFSKTLYYLVDKVVLGIRVCVCVCAYCRLSHKFIDMYNHKCSHSCRALDPNVYSWQFAIGITCICILDISSRWINRMIF